jgi:hypothetical protein
MKPLPLKTVIGAATPLPWKIGQREPITGIRVTNELLFVHAVNILPELINMIEEIEHWLKNPDLSPEVCDAYLEDCKFVLKKATTINIKKGN